jgi:hypothetical protein
VKRRTKVAAIGVGVVAIVGAATACEPTVVTARFRDGTPSAITVLTGDHFDDEPITDFDRLCALALTIPGVPHAELCVFWNPPKRIFWHQHKYEYYVGIEGIGYWYTVSEDLQDWHAYYTCEYYPFNGNCGLDNDLGRFAAISSEVGSGV